MVKVSVGVTIYNVEEYLRECLDSIMNQTFKDFEVIMVDDGSTDNSFNICQEYVARDNRFKLFHQENEGPAGARNTCLKYMHGEYITWIDSDDVVDNNYLERLLEVRATTKADVVQCGKKYIRNGNVYFIVGYEDGFINENGIFELLTDDALKNAFENYFGTIEFCGSLASKKLYKGFTLSQGLIYEDQGNKFKLYLQSSRNVLLLEQLYSYRTREGSIMNSVERGSLKKELNDLQVYTTNWDKLMYYIEISNYNTKEVREAYIKKLDKLSAKVNLSQEDAKIYHEAIDRHKQKISKL
ncbi:glycosyltransferase family 2 protein [Ligilactobacillus salivarius]|uniref:Glycosyl transferase n=1 Tax=Ligilactobacillus salivarius TaxID=1624 RepID=A0A1D7TQ80_9LACO|nr:glycosyltransferase family 2 protein [Ligilactobacillus salivarius]AOO73109.1 glycosyl transferase [Ligilactobacillus salivarius]UDE97332.1 glycosyltransferase [Ligilactobacillus salivarius]UUV96451.1 glycosyltransferase [Ligilactobacillus salivarius]